MKWTTAPLLAAAMLATLARVSAANPYDEWARAHFGTPLEPGAKYASDVDADGSSSLLEYAFGSDPKTSDITPVFPARLEIVEGQERVCIRYPRLSGDALSYFRYLPEASIDLKSWENPGGPLGLVDELDADQSPALPGSEWRKAWVPSPGVQIFLRLKVQSLATVWADIQRQRQELFDASESYAIRTNRPGDAPFFWPAVREFLPIDSPLRATGPLDSLGNPFLIANLSEAPQTASATVAMIGAGAERTEHLLNWESLARTLDKEYQTLSTAVTQFAVEQNKAPTSPGSWNLVQPYLYRHLRLWESQGLDPLGNAYQIGPTIADGVRFHPTTLQRLADAGWLEGNHPKIILSLQEQLREIRENLGTLDAALEQFVIEGNRLPSAAVTMADLLPHVTSASRLGRTSGLDPAGNAYLVGPTVADGIQISRGTLTKFAATAIGPSLLGELAKRVICIDLKALIAAVHAKFGSPYRYAQLDEMLSWELLREHIAADARVLADNGLDPFGNPYRIGPQLRDFITLAEPTFRVLQDGGVLDPPWVTPLDPGGLRNQLIESLRLLDGASDQYAIEANLLSKAPVNWALAAQHLTNRPELLLRGGRDPVVGFPYEFMTIDTGPRLNHRTVEYFNAMTGGWSSGKLSVAAYLMPGDLSSLENHLRAYQTGAALPDSHPISWSELMAWMDTQRIDFTYFHRAYGYDSLGNRPEIGPTLKDPVRINPASLARIEAAGIAVP